MGFHRKRYDKSRDSITFVSFLSCLFVRFPRSSRLSSSSVAELVDNDGNTDAVRGDVVFPLKKPVSVFVFGPHRRCAGNVRNVKKSSVLRVDRLLACFRGGEEEGANNPYAILRVLRFYLRDQSVVVSVYKAICVTAAIVGSDWPAYPGQPNYRHYPGKYHVVGNPCLYRFFRVSLNYLNLLILVLVGVDFHYKYSANLNYTTYYISKIIETIFVFPNGIHTFHDRNILKHILCIVNFFSLKHCTIITTCCCFSRKWLLIVEVVVEEVVAVMEETLEILLDLVVTLILAEMEILAMAVAILMEVEAAVVSTTSIVMEGTQR